MRALLVVIANVRRLARDPLLTRRNPCVDPLPSVQVDLLRRLRGDPADEGLLRRAVDRQRHRRRAEEHRVRGETSA